MHLNLAAAAISNSLTPGLTVSMQVFMAWIGQVSRISDVFNLLGALDGLISVDLIRDVNECGAGKGARAYTG